MIDPKTDPFLAHDELEMKVLEWLQDPGLLYRLQEAIAQREASKDYLVNEDDNATQLLFDIIQKQSVEIRGETGSGKNALVDAVLRIVPETWWRKVAGLTDKSIRYLPSDVRILHVVERKGMENGEDSGLEYDMKVSISEGKLTYLYVDKKEMVTKESVVDVGQFITTGTGPAFNELENRFDVIQTRDDREQNARVRDTQLAKATLFPWQSRKYEAELRIARKVVEHIDRETRSIGVIVPFARALTPLLRAEQQAVRRHAPKLINMIEACARIHYRQRPIVEGPGSERCLVALPLDLLVVLHVGRSNIAQMLGEMSSKMLLTTGLCKELSERQEQVTAPNVHALARERKLAELSSPRTVQYLIRALVDIAILRQRYDREGKAVKAYHGALVYDLVGDGSFHELDISQIMAQATIELDAWYGTNREIRLPPLERFYTFAPLDSGGEMAAVGRVATTPDALQPTELTSE